MIEPDRAPAAGAARAARSAPAVARLRGGAAPIALLVSALLPRCAPQPPVVVERRWPAMGTFATATAVAAGDATAESAAAAARAEIESAEAAMSNWRSDSGLSALNREAAAEPFRVADRELFACVELAFDHARRSGGAFDPTVGPLIRLWGFRPYSPRVPSDGEIAATLGSVGWRDVELDRVARSVRFLAPGMEIDLGGIGKGCALDRAREALERAGAVAGLVDLGGNLLGWGRPPEGEGWRIGIRDPTADEGVVGSIDLADRAVATSGSYENSFVADGRRFGHILDPATGRPAETDVLSATAIAERGADSDALSTALYVAGSARAEAILAATPGAEALLLVRGADGMIALASASLRGRLRLDAAGAGRLSGEVRFVLPPAVRPAPPAGGRSAPPG